MFSSQSLMQYLTLVSLRYYEGTPCYDFRTNSIGRCSLMRECATAVVLFNVDGRLHSDLCAYGVGEPIVCCADGSRKSEPSAPALWTFGDSEAYPRKFLRKVAAIKQVESLQPISEGDATANQSAATQMPTLGKKMPIKPTVTAVDDTNHQKKASVDDTNDETVKNEDNSTIPSISAGIPTSISPEPPGIEAGLKDDGEPGVNLETKFSAAANDAKIQKCVNSNSGLEGVCKAFDECKFSNPHSRPQSCGFAFDIPMVCCPQPIDYDVIVFPDDESPYYKALSSKSAAGDPPPPDAELADRLEGDSGPKPLEKSIRRGRPTSKWPTK